VIVYRLQNSSGEGPLSSLRPGESPWTDFAPIMAEHPDLFYGFACRNLNDLLKYSILGLEHIEPQRYYAKQGFSIISLNVDRVLWEDERELFFARRLPLHIGGVRIPYPPATESESPGVLWLRAKNKLGSLAHAEKAADKALEAARKGDIASALQYASVAVDDLKR
jgi:hypothetical protein